MPKSDFSNYSDVINYLYERLPVFHRTGAPAYKMGLGNIVALCSEMGNPQDKITTIHIAGTNGKGSVSHYLASILQSAGYKRIGLHTSPHLKDYRERIKIDGKPISEKDVVHFVNNYKYLFEKIECSFFELSTAMAFCHFAAKKCEIAVIETGMGGRFDSTNIITPILSVITNISRDHVEFLGNTLKKIAREKAGIIKPKTLVVIGESHEETKGVFLQAAKKCNSQITYADKIYKPINVEYKYRNGKPILSLHILKNGSRYIDNLKSELSGSYQLKNIPTVLASVDALNVLSFRQTTKIRKINKSAIKKGLAQVVEQTGLLGRWQVLAREPLTIADTGHNEAGIKEVVKQIKHIKFRKLHFVFGMVNDKDIGKVLALLPKNAHYYFCKADIPRALNGYILAKQAESFGLKGDTFATVKKALAMATRNAQKNDLVFVGGSTYVVGEVL